MTVEVEMKVFKFRSREHFKWFMGTMVLLVAIIIGPLLIESNELWEMMRKTLFFTFAFAALLAAVMTRGGRRNGQVFSTDCIWFNVVISAIYFGLWRFLA